MLLAPSAESVSMLTCTASHSITLGEDELPPAGANVCIAAQMLLQLAHLR